MEGNQLNFRLFTSEDIPHKVRWVNDPEVNRFLHYDLPLCPERTMQWYNRIINDRTRMDCIFEIKSDITTIPLGLIGLLNIDSTNQKAEFYIMLGEKQYWDQGIATEISRMFLTFCFKKYNLNKIYLYTEEDNVPAQKVFEKLGFSKEGLLKDDLLYMGKYINRFIFALRRKEFISDSS